MNVVVVIQDREAIPVRAIPLLTNWRFMSPDIVAHVLGGTGGSNVSLFGDMQSHHIEDGKVRPMHKDWWAQFPVMEMRAISEKIQIDESSHEAGYSEWRKLSLKALPAGVFVWKDDYQMLHDKNWNNRFRMTCCALKDWNGEESDEDVESQIQRDLARDLRRHDLVDDNPLKRDLRESLEVLKCWREPDYCPFMQPEMSTIVMEGFDSQQADAQAQDPTSSPAPVVQATETKEQRQDRRLKACIDAGLPMDTKTVLLRLPDGVGDVADREGVTRQTFSTDVKTALKRRESATREGRTVHRA